MPRRQAQSPIIFSPVAPVPWWASFSGAIHLNGILNVVGLLLTALGTYLTIRGNKKIKEAHAIVQIARRNILLQVAAAEVSHFSSQATILRVHVGIKRWDVSQHISAQLASKLQEATTAFVEVRGLDRDRLEVVAREASRMNQYLTSTTDTDDLKIQRVQEYCDYLVELLGGIYGSLKLKELEEIV